MTKKPDDTIATLTLQYQSGTGNITQRGVHVTEFNPEELYGLCTLRGRYRTFLRERIISCVNASTGEYVYDIGAHLMGIYKKLPRYTLDQLYEHNHELLQVLLYVGKADGSLRAAERKVIIAACKVFTSDTRLTDEMINKTLKDVRVPCERTFKVAVGRVLKRGNQDTMRKLLRACQTIVNTQKHITPEEQAALDYIAKRFKIPLT